MAKQIDVDDLVNRARRAQEDRITTIRAYAESRQGVANVEHEAARRRAELEDELSEAAAEAERVDIQRYNAARAAGWSDTELKKIGLDAPTKVRRVRKRTALPKPEQGPPNQTD